MNSRQIYFALLIVLMATIVTASPLNLDQLIKRKNTQKDENLSKEKDGKVKATVDSPRDGTDIEDGTEIKIGEIFIKRYPFSLN
ncbi:unnamed protein product [Rhizophagus irregularis]|uniref:Uncharacterized protein n=1 Tax=Rhizophagus irregularis TaxID=588596 RepID=A0A915ZCN3_9GLOM|nr:unnamed protein product [Rhizophagus irregularis]CAB5371598.1 unnamed protein product [Rhizophagus irregularis]